MSTSWSRDDFATVAKQNAGGEKGRAIKFYVGKTIYALSRNLTFN